MSTQVASFHPVKLLSNSGHGALNRWKSLNESEVTFD